MSDKEIVLEIKNLSVGYEKVPLQKPFSFTINKGQITTLIGPNGAGKSTILKTLIKQIDAISGAVFIDGKNLKSLSLKEFSRKTAALLTVSVKPELMTCRDVVEMGRFPYTNGFGILTAADKMEVEKAIQLVNARDYAEKKFSQVSDGQKQRILFARALCQEPKILILDEPASYLDIKWRLELVKILKKLSAEGVTIIASMHEIDLALKCADRILCVGQGEVKELSRSESECRNQIRSLYDLDEDFFATESAYAVLVKKFCNKGEGESLPPAPHFVTATPPSPKGYGSGIAFTETRSKLASQVLPADAVAPYPLKSPSHPKRNALPVMVQGTMSSAGKSFLVAALCRIFKQDGFSVAPFKSQNMALNSFVTCEGLEMGRAQVMQAEAAGVEPSVLMNPILLKPNSDTGSQVIVNGEVLGDMVAKEYFAFKKSLVPHIMKAYNQLASDHDIIVLEGAGSPAEINLKENDIVNMGMAQMAQSPVILVADIDRGGVFAQILGTIELLSSEERRRVRGFVINKFRGDKSILDSGIRMIEEKTGIPCLGTLPYMKINLDDEDSLSENLQKQAKFHDKKDEIQLAVVRLPHISNFTDFIPLQNLPSVNLYYVSSAGEVGSPDCIILPGTKNTLGDLDWLKESGLAEVIQNEAKKGTPIVGICGGFQMLGEKLKTENGKWKDENGKLKVESGKLETENGKLKTESYLPGGESGFYDESPSSDFGLFFESEDALGLGLLPVETEFSSQKVRTRVSGKLKVESGKWKDENGKMEAESFSGEGGAISDDESIFGPLSGLSISGYEIHQGRTHFLDGSEESFLAQIRDYLSGETKYDGAVSGNVLGTYIHGFFDQNELRDKFIEILAKRKGMNLDDIPEWEESRAKGQGKSQIFNGGEKACPGSSEAISQNSSQEFSSIQDFKESQYNLLADTLRKHLDMQKIYEIMGLCKGANNGND
ncbi:cobyric acid synthase [Treponema sp.]|uniref:cobyric acid synthase n=1 Tax=Treponema sp. TaxID=166 RepID=UPI0025E74533|nr:cobyric acid synthase [Treponema sp.]MBR4322619.1 cobyric acid synthase [Treponema sp.]